MQVGPSRALHRRITTACADLEMDATPSTQLDGVEVRRGGDLYGTFVGNRLVRTSFAESIDDERADPVLAMYSRDLDIDPLARAHCGAAARASRTGSTSRRSSANTPPHISAIA